MPESLLPATLTIKTGPDTGKVVPLTQGATTIGRVQPADLVISHAEISRSHARVFHKEGAYFVEDLGSSNGTFVNGKKITAPQVLLPGDTLQLGSEVTLVFGQTVGEGETEINVPRASASETEVAAPKPAVVPAPVPAATQAPPPSIPRAAETIVDLEALKPPAPTSIPPIPPPSW
jgi:pSer/pThr/pTyr-binding forkhead associated (FHA) protein